MASIPRPLSIVPYWWTGAAINTLDATRWRVFLARWLGRRYTGQDGTHTIIGYEWRGRFYLTDYVDQQISKEG